MKFQSLMAAVLLPLLLLPMSGSGATPISAGADVAAPGAAPAATGEDALDSWVYRNGDLVLDIRDSAGAEIVRTGLAYFFRDDHIATANEAPAAPAEALDAPQPALAVLGAQVEQEQAAGAELPEPLSLGLLGAGVAVLGWTRRQGNQAAARGWKQRLVRAIWPWPSLSWLDS